MSEQADCGSADLDTSAYVPFSEHTRKLAEVRLSKQRALQACEAELSDLRAAAQEMERAVVIWLSETGPGMHVNTAKGRHETRQALESLRAALNPKESA